MSDNEELSNLAREILRLAQNELLVRYSFLSGVLTSMDYFSTDTATAPEKLKNREIICTDWEKIYYSPKHLAKLFRKNHNLPTLALLHIFLHAIFLHGFVDYAIDKRRWNLACDIAVESVISELVGSSDLSAAYSRLDSVMPELAAIKNVTNSLTAEKIYSYLCKENLFEEELTSLEEKFALDCHDMWYKDVCSGSNADESSGQETNVFDIEKVKRCKENWKRRAEIALVDLETFSKRIGEKSLSLSENLSEAVREKYNYEEFLKKFCVMNEIMRVNLDEFDYIYYSYGLSLYKNMPLIEPLEYKEDRVVRELVIAIDTSGSVQGAQVASFLRKTYNILLQIGSYSSRFNIHIVQCDSQLQYDTVITNLDELNVYINNFTVHGFGGTDFRPVFEYVDLLRKKKVFRNLKGLLYFTDGYGIFPQKAPGITTAFIFVGDNTPPQIPPWAISLKLPINDIIQEDIL